MKKESFFEKYQSLIVAAILAIAVTACMLFMFDLMLKDYEKSLNENQIEENIPSEDETE